jgi:hypothetical protein
MQAQPVLLLHMNTFKKKGCAGGNDNKSRDDFSKVLQKQYHFQNHSFTFNTLSTTEACIKYPMGNGCPDRERTAM